MRAQPRLAVCSTRTCILCSVLLWGNLTQNKCQRALWVCFQTASSENDGLFATVVLYICLDDILCISNTLFARYLVLSLSAIYEALEERNLKTPKTLMIGTIN
jgi:hypothetical protein